MGDSIESVWDLRGEIGELNSRSLAGTLDLTQPQLGLLRATVESRSVRGNMLCIRRNDVVLSANSDSMGPDAWPAPLSEAYVRGGDLVATYSVSEGWPYSPQIYWRADTLDSVDGVRGSLALMISVQTHLLDTFPKINVSSRVAAAEIMRVIPDDDHHQHIESPSADAPLSIAPEPQPCCILWRLQDGRTSYAEIMLENDFHRLEVCDEDNRGIMATWHVFADFLEKGVIRRARLQSVFLPRERDVELAAACCRALEKRPLPLTT